MDIILTTVHKFYLSFIVLFGFLILERVRKKQPFDAKAFREFAISFIVFWVLAISIEYIKNAYF